MITKRTTTGYKGFSFNRKPKKNGVTLSMAWELWENKAIAQNDRRRSCVQSSKQNVRMESALVSVTYRLKTVSASR